MEVCVVYLIVLVGIPAIWKLISWAIHFVRDWQQAIEYRSLLRTHHIQLSEDDLTYLRRQLEIQRTRFDQILASWPKNIPPKRPEDPSDISVDRWITKRRSSRRARKHFR